MEKVFLTIIKFRWGILLLTLLLTLFLGYQIGGLKINSDVISSLPDSDPHAALLKKIGRQFGGNRIGMVILESDNIFNAKALEHVKLLTETVKSIDGISYVTSLTNMISISSGPDGLSVGTLVDEYDMPETAQQLSMLKEQVLGNDMYKGVIISDDGTATIVIFALTEEAVPEDVASMVKKKTRALQLPEKLYYAGAPMVVSSISDLISKDIKRLIPISFLVIAFVLLLSFRSISGVVLPLLTAAISIVWTIGLMALGGFQMSMISNNIPILILAVGSAYTIHVINRIRITQKEDFHKTVTSSMVYIFIPVILSALTTMIGFLSFLFGAYLEMIRDFGIFTALGTFFSVLLSLVFIPALEVLLYGKGKFRKPKTRKSILTEYFLAPLVPLMMKHPKYIFTAWMALTIIGIGGISLIKRSVDIKDYFKKGNPAQVAEDLMSQKFGGSRPVFLLFKGDMNDPEVLNTMMKAGEYMKKNPYIVTTQSVAQLIAEISDKLGEGKTIPDSREKVEQLWFLLEGNEIMQQLVSDEKDQGIVISKFISPYNKDKREFGKYMDTFIQENSRQGCEIEITGMPFIDLTMDKSLINSQMGSLGMALIFVVFIVGLIFRSLKKGIFAAIPIVATIIFLFGVMGFTGIPLNIATVLVASVALGIGIDYCIHVISEFNHSSKNGEDITQAMTTTVMRSGRPIMINVLSVSAGFLILIFSEMLPLQYFGILIALSMFGSSMGALTLLPVILILTHRKKKFHNK